MNRKGDDMIRGVSFRITTKQNWILKEILDNINVEKYNWYNVKSQKEAWHFVESREKEFLENTHYQGIHFRNEINKMHYVVFLKLEAYCGMSDCYDLHTYEDFKKSECEILFLLYDCEFIEVFAKEESVIQNLYENAQKKQFDDVEYITDINDGRIILNVL